MDRNLLELLCLELPQISMVCWSLLNTLALDFIPSMSLMSFVLPGLLLKMAGVVSLVQERVPHSWTSVYVLSVGKASKLVLIVWWCLMWYVCCWNFWTKYSFAICCTQYIYTHTFILTSNHMLERQLCAFSATSSPRHSWDGYDRIGWPVLAFDKWIWNQPEFVPFITPNVGCFLDEWRGV